MRGQNQYIYYYKKACNKRAEAKPPAAKSKTSYKWMRGRVVDGAGCSSDDGVVKKHEKSDKIVAL